MTPNDVMFRIVDALEKAGVPYMLVGSYSSNAYGIPRSTQDADFVVELGTASPQTVFDQLRPDIDVDPQLQFETVTGSYRYVAAHAASDFTAELFLISNDEHNQERFRRRHRVDVHGRQVWLPTAEDVVIQKLRWYVRAKRPKDLDDARNVLAVQKDLLDLSYVRNWCDRHGSRAVLEELLSQVASL